MEVAPAHHSGAVSQVERVMTPEPATPVAHIHQSTSISEPSDLMSTSSKNIPNGYAPIGAIANGSTTPNAQSSSAHAPSFPATNVWATRSQKQRPQPASADQSTGTSLSTSGPPSASMSRASSRRAKSQAADLPQLDVSAWPDVRETLHAPTSQVEKDTNDKFTNGSPPHKKGTALCDYIS